MKLRLMTYNIRYNTPQDGKNAWPFRKERVLELIKESQPAILGLQEVLFDQLEFLRVQLPNYSYLGVGRDDGKSKGEFTPIFYQAERFELQSSNTFWLSETPSKAGSLGWDANLPRTATWAFLKEKESEKSIFFLNTHFDHLGEIARQNSVRLILDKLKEFVGSCPFFLAGDLNAEPDSLSYQMLSVSLKDAFLLSQKYQGKSQTYRGFQVAKAKEFGKEKEIRIDYIFCSQEVEIISACTLESNHKGLYPSDHVPVLIEVEMP